MKFFKMAVAVDHQHHEFKSTIVNPSRCRLQSYPHLSNSTLEFDETNISRPLKQQQQQDINELNNIGVHRSFSTPCLSVLAYNQEEEDLNINHEGIEVIGGHQDPKSRALITKVILALKSGSADPVPASSGLSGAYLLPIQDNGTSTTIAVIKPTEEPIASGSPKGFSGRMLGRPGKSPSVRIGETGPRELAAYLLDHGGFSGVPPTALLRISSDAIFPTTPHSEYKMMSVQCFVDHESDAADFGPSCFSVASIHKIGVLDIRLLNLDRHAGNMLVKEKELVPIDHGLCLPEKLDDPYFEWLHWPQALVPFSESEIAYIMDLNPTKDAELIRNEVPSIRESSIRVLVVCTVFLKQAVIAGLSLADIGEMMTREYHHSGEDEISFSLLESLCMRAKATSMICMEEGAVSFGEVSEEEWLLFLNVFEKLLPQFFEGSKKKKGNCC